MNCACPTPWRLLWVSTTPSQRGPRGPAQAEQIDHIADWYVRAGIIPAKPDMAGSTLDLGPAP